MSKVLSLEEAGREIAVTCGLKERPFFFMVGAGISYPSVPLAQGIISDLEARNAGLRCDSALRPMDAYAWWLDRTLSSAGDKQAYFRGLIERKNVTHAHLRLAHLLLGKKPASLVVTVNFDDFLTRAIHLFGGQCVVCDHNATIERIDPESDDIQIVHVHGSYFFYDLRNLPGEIEEQAKRAEEQAYSMRDFVEDLLGSRSPIVVGYSGWENDVFMQALKRKLKSKRRYNLYWFCFRRAERDSLPAWLVDHADVRLVLPPEVPPGSRKDGSARLAEVVLGGGDPAAEAFSTGRARGERPPEGTLSATRVFEGLIRALESPTPALVSDPLEFLADHLDGSLPKEQEGEQMADLYSLARVMEQIRRARQLLQENKRRAEERMDKLRDALRRSQYREAATLAGTALELELNDVQLRELMDGAWKSGVELLDASVEELAAYAAVVDAGDRLIARETADSQVELMVAKALVYRGWTLDQLGRGEEEIGVYDQVVTRYGEATEAALREWVAWALVNKGGRLGQLGRGEEEIGVYDQVVTRYGEATEAALREQVALALVSKGWRLGQLGRGEEEIGVYDQVVTRYGEATEAALREWVAWALFNKGWRLGQLGRGEEAIGVYDQVVTRYGEATEAALREQVARALFNKGVRLGELGRGEEAIGVYDQVVTRYGEATEAALREQVARALFNKGWRLGQLGRGEEAIGVYDQVVTRYGEATEAALREQVARALFNKGLRLGQLGRGEEEIGVYDQVVTRYGEATEAALREQVARALVNKGVRLGELGRGEEEIGVYDQVVTRYGEATEAALREWVARALFNKGWRLGELGRGEEEIGVYDQVVTRYGEATEAALREQVARALVNKGVRLGELGRGEEAIGVYDQVVTRYGEATEAALREQVARALVNKGWRLGELGRGEEAIGVYDQVVTRYGEATEAALREWVARALFNKGLRLGQLGRGEEEIGVYDQVVTRYGEATEAALREWVARALNGIGFSKLIQAKRAWRGDSRTETEALLVRAQASLHRALERNPRNAMVLGNLGYAAFLLGDREKARQRLQSAIAIGGEEIRAAELADSEIDPIPEDEGFREVVRSIPGAQSQAVAGLIQ